jgi:L-asparaginase
MSFEIRKICLIYAGGTATAIRRGNRIKQPDTHIELLDELPELRHLQEHLPLPGANAPANMSENDIVFYRGIDSANCTPTDWIEIARRIYEHREQYSGFVVTHGTDTMVYTASALAFLLQGLNKPVVLTGAQLPLSGELVSDARNNLLNACRVAAQNLGEVVICFGSNIIRGCRARKISEFDLNAFTSTEASLVGNIGIRININDKIAIPSGPLDIKELDLTKWEKRVCLVKLTPGMTPRTLRSILLSGVRGVVIEGFGAGNIPDRNIEEGLYLFEPIREAIKQNIAIVLAAQCPIGTGDIYQTTTTEYKKLGIINAYDMTTEAAVVKLMWVLGHETEHEKIRLLMQKPIANEITVPKETTTV